MSYVEKKTTGQHPLTIDLEKENAQLTHDYKELEKIYTAKYQIYT